MIENFRHRYSDSFEDTLNIGQLISEGNLTNEEALHLKRIKEAWNFYEGYHWEGIDDLDTPQVTFNYCRPFINKFVSFEFGKGFSIKSPVEIENEGVTVDDTKIDIDVNLEGDGVTTPKEISEEYTIREKTESDFLNQVWENNDRETLITELGQTKAITGEAWVKVQYESAEDLDGNDPFEEYPNGRIRLSVLPTQFVFPRFNNHDRISWSHYLSCILLEPRKKLVFYLRELLTPLLFIKSFGLQKRLLCMKVKKKLTEWKILMDLFHLFRLKTSRLQDVQEDRETLTISFL